MGQLDCKPAPKLTDESSPLMVATRPTDGRGVRPHGGTDESSKSALYMFLLTVSIGGLQIVWSVELGNGSPYLLSLGMSKSLLAVVWIASPLTGALVQPYIGIRSDNCRHAWGKRKPFMVVGGAATIVSLLALAWVKELVGGFLSIFGVEPTSAGAKITIIIMATIFMYCLDVAINTVQAAIRAFIVDNCPTHQQELSNAWASRMVGVGNILGYIFGYMDLPKLVPWLGNTQFKVLCMLSSAFLIATLAISCFYIQERDPRGEGPVTDKLGVIAFFKQIIKSIRSLPTQISRVCQVQIAAWVGWFPFLYYSTTYVGQLYANPIFADHPDLSDGELDKIWEDATRVGALALLIYAIISFLSNMLLPLFVVPLYAPAPETVSRRNSLDDNSGDYAEQAASRLSFSNMPAGNASEPLLEEAPVRQETEKRSTWLSRLQIPGLTLPRVWLLSHLLFAVCMFSTFFISSHQAGSAFVGLVGIAWAVALWAPFALISAEVARIDPSRRENRRKSHTTYTEHAAEAQDGSPGGHGSVGGSDVEHGQPKDYQGGDVAQAGIILGLHNMAVSLPQILSSLVCSAIFKASQKPRGEPWDDSVGWVLRFGGCLALVAAWLTRRVSDGR
ncbi:Major facilitator superfamily domain general substrate transporter [Penicillium vulpinum]|uniref:Sucrose transporter n=1 Tax=Penicillium vulpinum TaxID=29845 RepID=A0A1V6SEM9_9EURO|nr:Major facilitator superfamily domain general substrate transporter [Penicillium vulpinum]KAJ5958854.1 Major facilitator superfamily domain general substrate transporter [Penicillium vulpinum]OQE12388.1 hypothetical protein PENVUL_c001G07381 [Penicillium vulpinum]